MNDGALATAIVLAALVVTWQAASHTVRWRLRKWIERERVACWEDTRYVDGYRAALDNLDGALARRRVHFKVQTEGEI